MPVTNNIKKSTLVRDSFFRSEAMEKSHTPTLNIELLARPLSFRLISLVLTAIIIIAIVYLRLVYYTSTHITGGNVVQAHDSPITFVAVVLPEIALLLDIDDPASVQFDAYPVDQFGQVRAKIILIKPLYNEVAHSPRVQIVLLLEQDFVQSSETRIQLQPGLTGQVTLMMETKSLFAWVTRYFR